MNRLFAVGLTLVGLCLGGAALAAGNPEAGQQKAAPCAACHGLDGNSTNGQWPRLAGQHPEYIVSQLKALKEGKRQNPFMSPMAMALSDEDMADLAAYFSKQRPQIGGANPALAEDGRQALPRRQQGVRRVGLHGLSWSQWRGQWAGELSSSVGSACRICQAATGGLPARGTRQQQPRWSDHAKHFQTAQQPGNRSGGLLY